MRRLSIRATAVVCAGFVGLLMPACAEIDDEAGSAVPVSESSQPSSAARPTLTDPALQPPPLENEYSTGERPQVVFDPCTWISDQAVEAAGLDPSTRRRGDDLVAEYSFLTCDFDSAQWNLQINSGNVTWEEDFQKNGANSEPLTVNGREAMWVRDPQMRKACSIHLRTKAGFVMMTTTRTFEASEAGLDRCDGVLGIAQALEPEIGEGN